MEKVESSMKYTIYTPSGTKMPASKNEAIKDACSRLESIIDLGETLDAKTRTERLIAIQKTLAGIIHSDQR